MFLIIGDLHFTDNARDLARFAIFDWIKKQQVKREPVATFLLGDITESKDRHSATLVNKIVSGLVSLKPPVYVLKGNHDYSDPKNPYFKFLNHIEGIEFVIEPSVIKAIKPVALIPHYRSQDEFDRAVRLCSDPHPACVLVHQTFEGAIAESGVRLSGLRASPIESLKPRLGVYAGDVHRPQTQGLVTYVGCPYQVRFGDSYTPRSLLIDAEGTKKNLYFESPYKHSLTIRGADDISNNDMLRHGDQVKLTIQLPRESAVEWKHIKTAILKKCRQLGLEVFGVKVKILVTSRLKEGNIKIAKSNKDLLINFCRQEGTAKKVEEKGLELINE